MHASKGVFLYIVIDGIIPFTWIRPNMHVCERFIGDCHPFTYGEHMMRRTVTFDPAIDQLVNLIRGLALLIGLEYNYTEVVNGLAYYGVCYWLNIQKDRAVTMAPQVLTSNLKFEGITDELLDKLRETMPNLKLNNINLKAK
ncbi:MAG: hypothetical protein OEW62_02870 [Candidatus Bathyarchaeota archaeon]|nr:hypothetical protein [Candidatus Bathyarchaeota archaeon]